MKPTLRKGGHHISVNIRIVNGQVTSTTPCFLGSDPASTPLLGPHLHRPLGGVKDVGRELARSLDVTQARGAVVSLCHWSTSSAVIDHR